MKVPRKVVPKVETMESKPVGMMAHLLVACKVERKVDMSVVMLVGMLVLLLVHSMDGIKAVLREERMAISMVDMTAAY